LLIIKGRRGAGLRTGNGCGKELQVLFASAIDGHAPATSRPGKCLIYISFTTITRISKYS